MATKNTTTAKQTKRNKIDSLRYNEYYGMQEVYDNLFQASAEGATFGNLMDIIISRDNILLAYRSMKGNTGSVTPGTDKLNIQDIAKHTPDEVVNRVRSILKNYTPRPVRRKDIPKPNGTTRPLGIPCIWDRLIQQATLQVLEPICEAKFSNNSFGFRPNRSCEHAISRMNGLMQLSKLHFVVEVDIKSFFDEVNHSKLIKQIWTLGIRDKRLIYVIRRMLTAPIRMPDSKIIRPTKGTPQGGILSPLLANIVLNELDMWIESQWQENPVCKKYKHGLDKNGGIVRSHGYRAMRDTNLKEVHIVRYADDFRIFCRTRSEANKMMVAVTEWLEQRLKLQVSPDKTRIVNLKRQYSEFLGFRLKVAKRAEKYVLRSRVSEKAIKNIKQASKRLVKDIAHPADETARAQAVLKYNSLVMGVHNYYHLATLVAKDFGPLGFQMDKVMKNCLGKKLRRTPKSPMTTNAVVKRYGKSKQLRYVLDCPVAPIGYVRYKTAIGKKRSVQKYTAEGRAAIHDSLGINTPLMLALMQQNQYGRSVEFMDNRISLFCAQYGKCAVTHREFLTLDDIHCHHILPCELGGSDKYRNLTLVFVEVHRLIHATTEQTINKYMAILKLSADALERLNKLRKKAGLEPISAA